MVTFATFLFVVICAFGSGLSLGYLIGHPLGRCQARRDAHRPYPDLPEHPPAAPSREELEREVEMYERMRPAGFYGGGSPYLYS